MTQENKNLLLKDLCARLLYNVVICCTDSDTNYNCFLTTDILSELLHNIEYYSYKPYLRSMSSMTDEEKTEYFNMHVTGVDSWYIVDWLNKRYLDYHYLVYKGLALEAPEDMYK